MDREKLQQNPLPIDRVAARVTGVAKPEDLWRPMPKKVAEHTMSKNVLQTAKLSLNTIKSKPELASLVGKRRDRLTIIGYAADNANRKETARWVVRCDCGNYEYRTRIFRWLGTAAKDMCMECRNRMFKLRGEWNDRDKACRQTVDGVLRDPARD